MGGKTYIVEHLEPEVGPWSILEYAICADECTSTGSKFFLTSLPESLSTNLPEKLQQKASEGKLNATTVDVQNLEGIDAKRVCLLDPSAAQDLCPEDVEKFDWYVFGGILGDDPPRDRTAELRKYGFEGRRLGPVQMTTDTAVRVTRIVVEDGVPLDKVPYADYPELRLSKHETTQMPFRYVTDKSGKPVMPEGMLELIKKDADKAFEF